MMKRYNYCIYKGVVCVTSCGITHPTLNTVCLKMDAGIPKGGECSADFTCPVSLDDAATLAGYNGTMKTMGTTLLSSQGVSVWAKKVAGGCALAQSGIKGAKAMKSSGMSIGGITVPFFR